MSNDVAKGLLLASALFILHSPVFADPQTDCTALDSNAAQNSSLANPPGYCTLYNTGKAAEDLYQPPGPCLQSDDIATFTLGTPAVLECGSSRTSGGTGGNTQGSTGSNTNPGTTNSTNSSTLNDAVNSSGNGAGGSAEQGMQ